MMGNTQFGGLNHGLRRFTYLGGGGAKIRRTGNKSQAVPKGERGGSGACYGGVEREEARYNKT